MNWTEEGCSYGTLTCIVKKTLDTRLDHKAAVSFFGIYIRGMSMGEDFNIKLIRDHRCGLTF